jgi:hypothetical protein
MPADRENKQTFTDETNYLKRKVDEIYQKIKYLETKTEEQENLKKIKIASHYIDIVSIYCAMTDLSVNLLSHKNESYLDAGRKALYKAIIVLEDVVSNTVDMPLGENYELLASLENFSDSDRLGLIRNLGYTISLIEDRYGKNTKWKWSFVEMEGRYAVIAKNLFDFRSYQKKNDPTIEGFDDRYDYLFLVKDFLIDASNRYREKYELTNHSTEDMRKAIEYLRALKRIHILFNEKNEVQNVTKRIELWSQKFEADIKAKEQKMKIKAHEEMKNRVKN